MSAPASLSPEIHLSAQRGELQKVVKWLRKGGSVGGFCPTTTIHGRPTTTTLLQAAAGAGHLAIVKELLKRGASVDLPTSLGCTALMDSARNGHLAIVFVLLQHSANPDLQANDGMTALMTTAYHGLEACVKALLRAKANTELRDKDGDTSLQYAELKGHTALAKLLRQHAAPQQPAAAAPAAPPDAGQPAESAPASLPLEIQRSAERGELQTVVKWLRKGGSVGAICSAPARDGLTSTFTLLHIAAARGELEMVRELLKRARASTCRPASASPRSWILRATATSSSCSSSYSTRPTPTCRTSTASPP